MTLPPITDSASYLARHTGPDASEEQVMLDALGYESLDALVDAALPADIRRRRPARPSGAE